MHYLIAGLNDISAHNEIRKSIRYKLTIDFRHNNFLNSSQTTWAPHETINRPIIFRQFIKVLPYNNKRI